ncbi:hypothetical protein [Rhodobaculum claviforme]|uniref:Uncharacterized protein n=1 Tax=Rhodobaculum claviforme TaxID=1549854 RepID=A0A934TLZ5_9RHOB|nr:hypothetical protein [Rhodobaculum claviforme]MBK5927984.1 hypothetical protein [Rhodobaculum claviforme]
MSRHTHRFTEHRDRPTCYCGALTDNERRWIEFLRDISGDGDPPVTLRRVQLLRRAIWGNRGRRLAR